MLVRDTSSPPATAVGTAVGLTFDDGPDATWTPRVLDALALAQARATFFVIAPRAVAELDVVARMEDEGHRVELHCHDHVRHTERTEGEVSEDVERALEQLDVLGVRPRLWRTPWGARARFTPRVAERFGLRLVGWDADTHDWRGDDAVSMLHAIRRDLEAGAIVRAHDGLGPGALRTDCGHTVSLVGLLAADVRARDLRLEPLDHRGRPA